MPAITPNLWFDTQSKEAAEFYVSVFPNSEIKHILYYGEAGPRPAGSVLTVDFVLDGQELHGHRRRPPVHVQRGDLALDQLRRPGRGRLLLDEAHRRRRGGPVRVAEGSLRPLVAGHPRGALRAHARPGRGARAACDGRDAQDGEDRRRGAVRGRRPDLARRRVAKFGRSKRSSQPGKPMLTGEIAAQRGDGAAVTGRHRAYAAEECSPDQVQAATYTPDAEIARPACVPAVRARTLSLATFFPATIAHCRAAVDACDVRSRARSARAAEPHGAGSVMSLPTVL